MEPRFGADFSQVRVHADAKAADLNRQAQAHAFTTGGQIYFGQGKFKPETQEGRELIAHELTHTIQQGAAPQRAPAVPVRQQSPTRVQRLGVSDALNYFADKANLIPGFRLLTVIIGLNPINMSRVERSAANILRAMIEFFPGGVLVSQALEAHGIFDRVGTWVTEQIAALNVTGAALKQALSEFLDTLSWRDIFDLGGVWERAKRIFTEPIGRLINRVKEMASGVLKFIREAILLPLAKLAEGTRGYDLLKAVLGEDPVTGQPVPRNAETLIGGFMKFIGEEEIWENIKKANAIARCWAWFQGAVNGLMGFVRQIPGLFVRAVQTLEIADLILVPRAFAKLVGVFGDFAGQFFKWAGNALWTLLEIIFEVVAPAVIPYIKKAIGAFRRIIKNPITFIRHLITAIKGGIQGFVDNIWTHLKTGFLKWLFGALTDAGIEIPDGLPSITSILQLVMNVLGLTMARLRAEAVKLLGPTAVAVIEKLVEYVRAFWEGGIAGLWAKIKEDLSNLKQMAIDAIQDWIVTTIVKQAVVKLLSLFNPVGAFVQAILAIYNTIQVVVERIKQIAEFIAAVIDSVDAISKGATAAASKWIEGALARAIPIVLALLAGIAGLGGLSKKVREFLEKAGNFVWDSVRKLIKKGIDWVKKAFAGLFKKDKPDERTDAQKSADLNKALGEAQVLQKDEKLDDAQLKKALAPIKQKYRLTSLEVVVDKDEDAFETLHVEGEINPKLKTPPTRKPKPGEVGEFDPKIPRPSFTITTLQALKEKYPGAHRQNVAADKTTVKKGFARRHIVSSQDMAEHYETVLRTSKLAKAKELLKGGINAAKVEVNPLTAAKCQSAAIERHKKFFNHVGNLFLGDSKENSAIGRALDDKNPAWEKKDLDAEIKYHTKGVARDWGLKGYELVITDPKEL